MSWKATSLRFVVTWKACCLVQIRPGRIWHLKTIAKMNVWWSGDKPNMFQLNDWMHVDLGNDIRKIDGIGGSLHHPGSERGERRQFEEIPVSAVIRHRLFEGRSWLDWKKGPGLENLWRIAYILNQCLLDGCKLNKKNWTTKAAAACGISTHWHGL